MRHPVFPEPGQVGIPYARVVERLCTAPLSPMARAALPADAGIVLLFFLHGAKLSREAIWEGARNWRLHLATLGVTFGLFPLRGIGFAAIPVLPREFAAGLLFLFNVTAA